MNRRILLVLLVILSIIFMFIYRNYSSQEVIKDPSPVNLYSLGQDQKDWLSMQQKLIIAVADDSYPLIEINSHGIATGILADYMNFIETGYKTDLRYLPALSKDIAALLESGEADIALTMYDSKLENNISYTTPIVETKGVLMYEKSLDLNNSEGGKGFIVSVVKDDPSIDKLSRNFPEIEFVASESIEEATNLLKTGKANSIAGSEASLHYFLGREYFTAELVQADGYTYEKSLCLGVPKDNTILFEILNNAIYHIDNAKLISSLQPRWTGISYSLTRENLFEKTGIISLILFTSVLAVFFVFYQSNKSLYEELQERMELLIESRNEMQTTFDGVTYYLAEVNKEGRIVDINRALSQYLRTRRQDAIGLPIYEVLGVGEAVAAQLSELIRKTFQMDKEHSLEYMVGKGIFETHSSTIKDTRGKVRKILLMIIDVTDQRSAERQMLQDNKMIAIGQLAAGVAHEIRNPLGLIRNYCYVLKELGNNDSRMRDEAIKVIEKSVEKSGKIIENLLNFSRISSNRRELTNLYVHVGNIIDLQTNWLAKRNIDVVYRFSGPHDVVVNAEALGLILINLISNGADAISVQPGKIEVEIDYKDKQNLKIFVSDNGDGIPKNIVEDIFNPFFTTKEKREGNGLGLYIVYNEVSKMGGNIKVDSEEGKGTTFTITIPIDGIIEEGAAE